MRTVPLALLAVLALTGDYPRFVVPDVPDLTIVTRTRYPHGAVSTTTVRLKGARQRTEQTFEPPQSHAREGTSYISQCDRHRTLILNHEPRVYGYLPVEDLSRFRARAPQAPRQETPDGAVREVVTIDAVDTGERRQVGPLGARHVITTTVTELHGQPSAPTVAHIQDGWYVDLPPAGCVDWGDSGYALVARVSPAGAPFSAARVTYLRRAKRGFPIIETDRSGAAERADAAVTELVEVSDRPIDPAVFEVPAGYQPGLPLWGGGFDFNRPDTLINRVQQLWEGVSGLVARFWR